MTLPGWADPEISKDLPNLRARGEGQDCEYMEVFPQQARDLGKEIAAFASTNPGTILLGVADDGSLVGLGDMDSLQQRDELLRRVEGICRGTIKPAITPVVKWAIESKLVVLIITVPKGPEPIYYSNNIPYVRHLSESRPAEPHEVIDRVRSRVLPQVEDTESSSINEPLSELSSLLIDTLIWGEEADERSVNPWLDQWRSQYEYAASRFREIAASQAAIENGWDAELLSLAKALESVAHFRLHLGCGPEFKGVQNEALRLMNAFKARYTDPVPLSNASLIQARDTVSSIHRRLTSLVERAEEMANSGRLDDLQAEVSQLGVMLLKLSYYDLAQIDPTLSSRLREIGRKLHLVETIRIYMDGGASVNALLAGIQSHSDDLASIANELLSP